MPHLVTNFNLFLKTLPLNENAWSGKSFPLLLMVKTIMSSIPMHIFTYRQKYINWILKMSLNDKYWFESKYRLYFTTKVNLPSVDN